MAKLLELAVDDFEARYVRRVGSRRSLIEFDNGDCVFFDGVAQVQSVWCATAPVPHLALLGLEYPYPAGLEEYVRSLSWQRFWKGPQRGRSAGTIGRH